MKDKLLPVVDRAMTDLTRAFKSGLPRAFKSGRTIPIKLELTDVFYSNFYLCKRRLTRPDLALAETRRARAPTRRMQLNLLRVLRPTSRSVNFRLPRPAGNLSPLHEPPSPRCSTAAWRWSSVPRHPVPG